jgi:hypothetical protein
MALSILSNANLMSLADLCSLDSRLGIWSRPIFFWTDSSQILAIQGSIRLFFSSSYWLCSAFPDDITTKKIMLVCIICGVNVMLLVEEYKWRWLISFQRLLLSFTSIVLHSTYVWWCLMVCFQIQHLVTRSIVLLYPIISNYIEMIY